MLMKSTPACVVREGTEVRRCCAAVPSAFPPCGSTWVAAVWCCLFVPSSFLRFSSRSWMAFPSISLYFGLLSVFAELRSVRQVERFAVCGFGICRQLIPSGHLRSCCCSSQLQIQEAAERRGLHRLCKAVEPRDPQQASTSEESVEEGQQRLVVCGCMWSPRGGVVSTLRDGVRLLAGLCRSTPTRANPTRDKGPHAPQYTH